MRLRPRLPAGVELFTFRADGTAATLTETGAIELAGLVPFIDPGQSARYFVGDAATSPERPSNATVKLGVVAPRSSFSPHAHAGEHFVFSFGVATCSLFDEQRGRPVDVPLTPSMMIRIPALLPHAFGNRGRQPLLILAANTGYGIDHEDYAITADRARAKGELRLAGQLQQLGGQPAGVTIAERLAGGLRRFAERLETA